MDTSILGKILAEAIIHTSKSGNDPLLDAVGKTFGHIVLTCIRPDVTVFQVPPTDPTTPSTPLVEEAPKIGKWIRSSDNTTYVIDDIKTDSLKTGKPIPLVVKNNMSTFLGDIDTETLNNSEALARLIADGRVVSVADKDAKSMDGWTFAPKTEARKSFKEKQKPRNSSEEISPELMIESARKIEMNDRVDTIQYTMNGQSYSLSELVSGIEAGTLSVGFGNVEITPQVPYIPEPKYKRDRIELPRGIRAKGEIKRIKDKVEEAEEIPLIVTLPQTILKKPKPKKLKGKITSKKGKKPNAKR